MNLQHRFVLRQEIGENVSSHPIRETVRTRDGGLGMVDLEGRVRKGGTTAAGQDFHECQIDGCFRRPAHPLFRPCS